MAYNFVKSQPALAPLFVAVGLGVVGSVGFAGYYLSRNGDVSIRKRKDGMWDGPWNDTPQHHNSKLFSWNKDAWALRKDMPDPRAAFLMDGQNADETVARIAKAKASAIKKAGGKEDLIHH